MKRWSAYLMVVLLMASCLALAGCGKEKVQDTSAPPAANEKDSSSSNELEDIMKSARQVTDLSFDITSTSTGGGQTVEVQGKYYISGKKIRTETETAGMKAITIVNAKGEAWMYNPADKTAMKLPGMENDTEMPNQWTEEEDLSAYKIVGHEKIDGYDCVVVNVTEGNDTVKMWLRKDLGMPVKMETKSPEGSITVQYKNYKVGKQSADLFELPADAQVMDMSAMPDMSKMPGMPNQ